MLREIIHSRKYQKVYHCHARISVSSYAQTAIASLPSPQNATPVSIPSAHRFANSDVGSVPCVCFSSSNSFGIVHTPMVPSSATVATTSFAGCVAIALRNRWCACSSQNRLCVFVERNPKTPLDSAITTIPLRTANAVTGVLRFTEKVTEKVSLLETSQTATVPFPFPVAKTHRCSVVKQQSGGNAPLLESTSDATSAIGHRSPVSSVALVNANLSTPSCSKTSTRPLAVPTHTCTCPSQDVETHTPRAHAPTTPPPSTTTGPFPPFPVSCWVSSANKCECKHAYPAASKK
mmetsp:Transcript_6454/g.24342  ORF Transcript_6454/g.24342 Transcript_6454/m.24342 type:complete len:291 (+) Transcript_6454:778-1650(+)